MALFAYSRLAYSILAIALAGLMLSSGFHTRLSALFGALAALAIAAACLKLGWLPLATILGIVVGVLCDGRVKGGTHESQMWETVSAIVGGALAGMAVGFYLDARSRVMSRLDLPPKSPGNAIK